ncbi:MAG TPA: Rrf2 family transcriptional regulator [Coriobacteriia bacterium]|nr:Rrf2 family transcriptional regulator [Coriobacteriia bacterium]
MKPSSKARYSLHLVIDIAQHQGSGPVSLREVSVRQDLSLKYLEQLAKVLAKEGYLNSIRGAQGGYLLARGADEITAGDIMRAAEGGVLDIACITDSGVETCPRQQMCGTSQFWKGLRTAIDSYIDGTTIAALAADKSFVLH